MWQELTTLWQSIRDPEYLHLLIEPLPLYGLGLGLIPTGPATLQAKRPVRPGVLLCGPRRSRLRPRGHAGAAQNDHSPSGIHQHRGLVERILGRQLVQRFVVGRW